jgi:methionine sulfoxide reductase heme-binding subunit
MTLTLALGAIFAQAAHALATAAASAPSPLLWYLTRTTAVSAYVALTCAVLLGMLRGVARGSRERLSWLVDELHQVLATVFAGLVVLHLLALLYDPYLPFSITNILLPVNEPYRPLAVILGVLALYSLVIVLGSTWIRRFIPYRYWRILHYVSFATFVLVTLHGLYAGSDTGEPWMRAVYAGASAAVGFLIIMRYLTRPRPERALEEPEAYEESADDGYEDIEDEEIYEDDESMTSPAPQFNRWPPARPDQRTSGRQAPNLY